MHPDRRLGAAVRRHLRDRRRGLPRHDLTLPAWIRTGNADAERQVLIAIAAAVITVMGVVFSITILALTLASQQFGPRMMRNFVRDIGNQVTLGVFVGTFVLLGACARCPSTAPSRDFVPYLSTSVAEALLMVDLGRADLLHPSHREVDPTARGHRGDRRRPDAFHRRRVPRDTVGVRRGADARPQPENRFPSCSSCSRSTGRWCPHRSVATSSTSVTRS